jgi:hypothetical protein
VTAKIDHVAVEVARLRIAISRLTGRLPASSNRRYLEQRLDDLRRRRKNGDDVRAPSIDSASDAPVSVNLPRPERDLLARLATDAKSSASQIVRIAIVEYARRHGRGADADHIQRMNQGEQP